MLLAQMGRGELAGVTTPRTGNKPETLVVLDDEGLEQLRDVPGEIAVEPKDLIESFGCNECGHNATTKIKLAAHMRSEHPARIISCDYCDYMSTYKAMRRHLEVMHFKENPFPCDQCDQSFPGHALMENHKAQHFSSKKYVCQTCNYHCSNKQRLKAHMTTHGRAKNSCNICGSVCGNSKELLEHMVTQHGTTPYRCELCEYSSPFRFALKRHMRVHTGERPFACDYCEYRSTEKARLKTHVMVHLNDKPFSCTLCEYKTTRKDHLKVHTMTHTQAKPYSCQYCHFKCATSGKLKEHMRRHTGEKPYSCDHCEYRASRKDYLDSHLRQHSGSPSNVELRRLLKESPGMPTKPFTRTSRRDKFTCEICDIRVSRKADLDSHMERHISKRPVASRMPSERTEDHLAGLYLDQLTDNHFDDVMVMSDSETDALEVLANAASFGMSPDVRDVIVMGTDITSDDVPSQNITTTPPRKAVRTALWVVSKSSGSAMLESAENSATSKDTGTPFACDLCDFRSKTRSSLKEHVTSEHISASSGTVFLEPVVNESGQKVYLCDYCNYSTIHRSAVRVHTKTHTGEKPYGCKKCDFKSTTMRRMKEHVMVHLGQKPFACNHCDYSTARKDHLKVHKLAHTGEKPHACEYCEFKSKTKDKLTQHRRTHTGEKPYSCDFCDYRASRKDYLDSHMRRHSGGPAQPRPRRPPKEPAGMPSSVLMQLLQNS